MRCGLGHFKRRKEGSTADLMGLQKKKRKLTTEDIRRRYFGCKISVHGEEIHRIRTRMYSFPHVPPECGTCWQSVMEVREHVPLLNGAGLYGVHWCLAELPQRPDVGQ